MTTFTLWIEHYQQSEKRGNVFHMPVGITEENIHVKTADGEYFMSMDDVVKYIIEKGELNEEV